jgi:hypothetical protein
MGHAKNNCSTASSLYNSLPISRSIFSDGAICRLRSGKQQKFVNSAKCKITRSVEASAMTQKFTAEQDRRGLCTCWTEAFIYTAGIRQHKMAKYDTIGFHLPRSSPCLLAHGSFFFSFCSNFFLLRSRTWSSCLPFSPL